jgi:orotidine-5'-phosphate decarboxylase
MNKILTPAERLIVAADFELQAPGQNCAWACSEALCLADDLAGMGIVLKINSVLRASGYRLFNNIRDRGIKVFADLKLNDIGNTLATDGMLLREYCPHIVTAMCSTGVDALKALKAKLPETEVLGVTVLTNQTDADTMALYGCSVREAVLRLADIAARAEIDGLISSPDDLPGLWKRFGDIFTYNTPGVRPTQVEVKGDDQNKARVMTPAGAIRARATRIVMGRPITQAPNRREAVLRTIEEIKQALA